MTEAPRLGHEKGREGRSPGAVIECDFEPSRRSGDANGHHSQFGLRAQSPRFRYPAHSFCPFLGFTGASLILHPAAALSPAPARAIHDDNSIAPRAFASTSGRAKDGPVQIAVIAAGRCALPVSMALGLKGRNEATPRRRQLRSTDRTMSRYQAVRFWILFVARLGFLMLWPVARELYPHRLGPGIFRNILLLSCVLAVSNKARIAIVVSVLAIGVVVSRWLFEFGVGMVFVRVSHVLAFVIMMTVAIAILTEILRAGEVTSQLVVGAVCVYLALAVVWAFLYYAIEAFAPGAILVRAGSFSATAPLPVADADAVKMLYVSLATITTLGNSDIPVTFLARQLATIEAITGQLYLAVLIARLVGFSSAASTPSDRSN